MREIKFRGFCNVEKKMYQNFYLEDHAKFAFMNELINSAQQRYTLMQYTGVKDDDGNEIYEGDIVRVSCALITLQSIDIDGEVKMLEGGWVIDSGSTLRNLWSEVHNVQIIGNIYECPRQ